MSSGTARLIGRVDLSERLSGLSWPGILLGGAGAFLVGYALTVLVVVLGPGETTGGVWGVLVLLAFVFYSAHNVPVDASGLGQIDWLETAASSTTPDPSIPLVVYYAIPILVLVGTSILVTSRCTDRELNPVQSIVAVLGMAGAYALLAVAGTFVFTSRTIFNTPAQLVLTDALIFGVAYPLVFGTIGAAVVGIVSYARRQQ